MPVSPERMLALRLLRQWQQSGQPPEEDAEWNGCSALTRELVLGSLRHLGTLDAVADHLSRRPPDAVLRPPLWIGLLQLLLLDGIADHAAVHETVEAAKRTGLPRPLAGYLNGLLRNTARKRDEILAWIARQPPHVRHSHPKIMVDRWTRAHGAEATERICAWNQQRAHTWVRLTRRGREAGTPVEFEPHPRMAAYYRLPRGLSPVALPGFAEGHWYAQDPSTSLAPSLLDVKPGERVLDACAAPGGKTALLADALGGNGKGLLSIDPNPARYPRLRENLARLGLDGVQSRCVDMTSLAGERFDAILLDVPCSNTGVLQRRPDTRWRFDPRDLPPLTALQRELLEQAAALLAPGGRIVYSTCSIEPEETTAPTHALIREAEGWSLFGETLLLPGERECDGAYACGLRTAEAF